jgi:4'-phosphopantetheinyl transferase EntD
MSLQGFFPPGVVVATPEEWMWTSPAFPAEENLLSPTAADKRQREFRAGRHCAHAAIEKLGYKDFPVLRGERGEPIWPEGVCGSISHAGERCIAITAQKSNYVSLGVDIERDREIKDDTLERISHERERFQLEHAPVKFSQVNVRAILFSIKECVHKVYYPLNKYTLDFQDVEVSFHWEANAFDLLITHAPSGVVCDINKLSGVFGYEPGYVYSRVCLRQDFTCA